MTRNVTLLAGGVGGAKMAEGFAALPDVHLTVIGNIADDDTFHGLWVSPDIDTLTYTLSGLINRKQGWGVADDGRRALDVLGRLGSETWMFLGDRDFGLHIYRTERRRRGDRPSDIARDVAKAFGVTARIVLPTDDQVQTRVRTDAGWLRFQEYFVREQCRPDIRDLRYDGIGDAKPTQEAIDALKTAELVVIAPSNPLVSIRPILEVKGIAEAVQSAAAPVIAVSPLVAGRVVKGPADRMMRALGFRVDAVGVAEFYAGLADTILIDSADEALSAEVERTGVRAIATDIMMPELEDKRRLASEILECAFTPRSEIA
ncbi:MAG: 2-phospho-L-lactate transferase [Pseudomonadota bacterium]